MNEYKSLAPRPVSPESLQAFKDRIEEYRRIAKVEQIKLGPCNICKVVDLKRDYKYGFLDPECPNCVYGENCGRYGGRRDRYTILYNPGTRKAIEAAKHKVFVMEKILEDYLSKFGDSHE